MPKPAYKLPGRLRKPGSKQRKRRETQIVKYTDPSYIRTRGISFITDAAMRLGFDLESWLDRRKRQGIETEVLEIGCGGGFALLDLEYLTHSEHHWKLKTHGIDIIPKTQVYSLGVNKYIRGDALKVKFPKVDFIFSAWALGYIGHPNVMVEKAAEALKPGGIAVLHFNSRGEKVVSHSTIRSEEMLRGAEKYFDRLALRGSTNTKNTRVKVVQTDRYWDTTPLPPDDWFVLIEKA